MGRDATWVPREDAGVSTWSRWSKYAKAKLDSMVRSGERELDRREAELEVEQAEKPWSRSDADTPSYEDVRARIEADAGGPEAPQASGEEGFDLAERERAAAERLVAIRESLGLPEEDPPPKP